MSLLLRTQTALVVETRQKNRETKIVSAICCLRAQTGNCNRNNLRTFMRLPALVNFVHLQKVNNYLVSLFAGRLIFGGT